MGRETTVRTNGNSLNTVAALAATTGGLQQTILALAACHGGKSGPWLDEIEAKLVRDVKNMVFNGVSMEAETAAVDFALKNIRAIIAAARARLR